MSEPLWKMPVPSTAVLGGGVKFEKLKGRQCALIFDIEGDEDRVEHIRLIVDGVEAFKCTYHNAREPEMLRAYDKLVDRGLTDWLQAIQARLLKVGEPSGELKHTMIYFDDGPCYEFICREFHVEKAVS